MSATEPAPPPSLALALLEPGSLWLASYDRARALAAQRPGGSAKPIPRTFLDALAVRERVFVAEQQLPLENELDDDDDRSCHWVVYARDPAAAAPPHCAVRARDDALSPAPVPVGTLRLVPFPHAPH